ncbi:SDR family NAD(P)-dependent oxidoreductase [Streptomyces sp. NPDC001663]|uniref:SDR family NAD(P)-dependent oxidoreductase n=1 Tax=Streptomyces sp. NPDC001663 TaxID=3364597 RepID=UPI0036CE8E20
MSTDPMPVPGQRTVLVTGAATGIGLAVARRFAAEGDRLVLNYYKDNGELDAVAAGHPGGEAAVLQVEADVSDPHACEELVRRAEAAYGRVDVLVTSAGIATWGPTAEFPWEDYERLMAVNLRGTYACVRAVLPGMTRRRAGRIITISSEVALVGMAEATAYAATKGAVIAMTKSLAREMAPLGVLVNSVAPGPTMTPLFEQSPESQDPAVQAAVPVGRFGRPAEIAGAVSMLAGPDGSFFVGQVVSPNGGAAI